MEQAVIKKKLHPNNAHNKPYDFAVLSVQYKPLKQYVIKNPSGEFTINFAKAEAVLALNTALLLHFYKIQNWQFPKNYLCPGVPGRADYIHYINDLIKGDETSRVIKGIDIGTGANCIYPLLATAIFTWKMVGTDIDENAVKSAQQILEQNKLSERLELRMQSNQNQLFKGVVRAEDSFDFSMCNPPFHESELAAMKSTQRKWNKLGKRGKQNLNFGGKSNELWCVGGELQFIKNMIKESKQFNKQIKWFTTLVSKAENLAPLYEALKRAGVAEQKTIEMLQGNKQARILAWRF